ncbi:hypothetical protein QVD17_26356 [Tagetes erecta]|uniref:BED-type domain-containing protein n=1 Tax=Tagetes erecta TaxID=13708 RepID=A0AAD8K992_TARER|nr:hypothetical protein QVD17_26356 [Tagetes erecta]
MVKRSEPLRGSINKMDVGVELQMSINLSPIQSPFVTKPSWINDCRLHLGSSFIGFSSILHRFQPSPHDMETEPIESNAMVSVEMQPEYFDTPMNDVDTPPVKRRKKKSIVWEYFTIESVGSGVRRACCKQCKQSFAYSTGSKVAGTSHLKRHIAKGGCAVVFRNNDDHDPVTPKTVPVSRAPKKRYKSPTVSYSVFDPDMCRQEMARMIIMHDYPLDMVEHAGEFALTCEDGVSDLVEGLVFTVFVSFT